MKFGRNNASKEDKTLIYHYVNYMHFTVGIGLR